MKRWIRNSFFLVMVIATQSVYGQIKIERSVIGSGGNERSSGNIRLSSTIGESVIATKQAQGITLTQGFQQAFKIEKLELFLTTFKASCPQRSNGRAVIDSIRGCDAPYQKIWLSGIISNDSTEAGGLAAGNYSINIVSGDGCQTLFQFVIENESEDNCLLNFFSGITPNNDERNDVWVIENIEAFPQNKVHIYNRLGNLVFEGNNYDNVNVVWKGNNLNGQELPSDTYFYVFESNGEVEKGWIELTR